MKEALLMLLAGLGTPNATLIALPAAANAQIPASNGASPPLNCPGWTKSDRTLEKLEFRRTPPRRFCGTAKTSREVGGLCRTRAFCESRSA